MHRRLTGLWRHPDFLKLWAGETISLFGSQVTALALPLTAAVALEATPAEMGIMGAARYAPYLLLTLVAGVWVDRQRRRPLLVTANLGRAILLAAVPALAVLGLLRMEHLYLVALLVGALGVLFDVAYLSFLPGVLPPERLTEGNCKLQASAATAEVTGPGLAGFLVQIMSAPLTLALDAISFLIAALSLVLIRAPEPAVVAPVVRRNIWADIGEGLRTTFRDPRLRAFAIAAANHNLFTLMLDTVFVLYVTREVGIDTPTLGLILASGSVGALAGSLAADRAAQRFGTGRAIAGAMAIGGAAPLIVPLAGGTEPLVVLQLVVSSFVGRLGVTIASIHTVSLRQAVTPANLLGRVNASYRFVTWGCIPFGAVLGGALGEMIGLRSTLLVAALGLAGGAVWVVFSPVPSMRGLPDLIPAGDP